MLQEHRHSGPCGQASSLPCQTCTHASEKQTQQEGVRVIIDLTLHEFDDSLWAAEQRGDSRICDRNL